jgi:ABC-type polysaccharide/polyol phosphate transport system ATPase subunit
MSIELKNVSLVYPLLNEKKRDFRSTIISLISKKKIKDSKFLGIKNINLKIDEGYILGVNGDNGSGKTTFLKLISGIFKPTKGQINISNNIYSLIDIRMGLKPDATGYENIFLNYYIFGKSLIDIEKKIKWIKQFSELEKNLYKTTRTYSSGMLSRLALSIALSVDPNILIFDEFISTIDQKFLKKVKKQFKLLKSKKKIIIIASHNKSFLTSICDKIIIFRNGKILN